MTRAPTHTMSPAQYRKTTKGNVVPGKTYELNGGIKNISDRYSFISLEHATSYNVVFPDDEEYTAVINYSYDVHNYIMINSSGLLMPFRESGIFKARSLSETSFCFWTGNESDPLMQATVYYEEDIPAEVTDPEMELNNCIHITDLTGTEGRASMSDIGKYGFHATETDDHSVKAFLNNGEVYYGNRIVEMPLVSEADLEKIEFISKVFTAGEELMAITYTSSLYKLFYADPENRRWTKIGEWERDNSDPSDQLSVAVQGGRAIIISNNREYHFVSDRKLSTSDMSWGSQFNTIGIYMDPVINETGSYIYFNGTGTDSALYRSRISGSTLETPEELGNGSIPQFMFHVLDDIAVINTGSTAELQEVFHIIIDGKETAVTDTDDLAGTGGIGNDMGIILNPEK